MVFFTNYNYGLDYGFNNAVANTIENARSTEMHCWTFSVLSTFYSFSSHNYNLSKDFTGKNKISDSHCSIYSSVT